MIKVVAKHQVQVDKINDLVELYRELVEKTRKEKGNISYGFYQDLKDPSIMTMLEEWESEADLENHLKSEHFLRIAPASGKYMAKEPELNVYKIVL